MPYVNPLDVLATAHSFQEEELRDKTVVVIDVLRASSTMIAALESGAKGIVPVEDMSDAGRIAQNLDSENYLLCGEKDGEKIEGYDLGNSPLEYTPDRVKGRTIIFKTTNGTIAIRRAHLAKNIYIGSFLNLNAVVNVLKQSTGDIILLCAGWRGRLALEDLLCAGNIIYELNQGELPENARDGVKIAFGLFEKFGNDISSVVKSSNHAYRLQGIVGEEDVSYCCTVNAIDILPVMNEGIITVSHGK